MMKKLLTGLLVALFALPSFASGDVYQFKTKPIFGDDGFQYDRDYPEKKIYSNSKQSTYGGIVDSKGRLAECTVSTMYTNSNGGAITFELTSSEPIETEYGRGHIIVTSIALFNMNLREDSKIKSVEEIDGRQKLKWRHDGMVIRVEPTNDLWMNDIKVVWETDGKTTSAIFPSVYVDIPAAFDIASCKADLLR